MVYLTRVYMICPTLPLSSSPIIIPFTHSPLATPDNLLFLEDIEHSSTSGSLQLLFPLQETLFPQIATWLSTILYSNIYSKVTSSRAFSDHSILNSISLFSFSISYPCHIFIQLTYHCLTLYFSKSLFLWCVNSIRI